MSAATSRCDVISGLIGRWHTGRMRDADRDAFEQHLLFCPPCLVQNDKARLAFAALTAAASEPPPDELVARLAQWAAERATAWAGGA